MAKPRVYKSLSDMSKMINSHSIMKAFVSAQSLVNWIANIYMVMIRCFRLREEIKLSQWCSTRCGLVKGVAKVDI